MTPEAVAFYDGAERRIRGFLAAVAVAGAAAAWAGWGMDAGAGFVLGSAVAFVNLVWLKQITAAFVEQLGGERASTSGWGVAARFLLRYVLIALFAYGMLAIRPASVAGFFAGLFVPVGAFFCEAVYEGYAALRRGR